MDCNAGAAELLYFSDINAYRQSANISRILFSLLISGKGSMYILLDPETSLDILHHLLYLQAQIDPFTP